MASGRTGGDAIPTSRVARSEPLARLASVNTLARVAGWARRGGDARGLARFAREAERYVAVLGEMKGAAMKVGQILSFLDSTLVPEVYRPIYHEIAGALQADAPPMPLDTVRPVIEEELAAFVVQRSFDPLGEWGDVVRGFSVAQESKDLHLPQPHPARPLQHPRVAAHDLRRPSRPGRGRLRRTAGERARSPPRRLGSEPGVSLSATEP